MVETQPVDARPLSMLVPAAAGGDQRAWDAIVDRFAGLVVGVARHYRLDATDVADVSQTVWLRLVERLGTLRDPQALPGWLVTTTRNECLRTLRAQRRCTPFDPGEGNGLLVDEREIDERLVAEERREVLRESLSTLPAHCRALLTLLVSDPPLAYDEISRRLSMPRGSIGPTRARCLDKLRRCPALAALTDGALDVPAGR